MWVKILAVCEVQAPTIEGDPESMRAAVVERELFLPALPRVGDQIGDRIDSVFGRVESVTLLTSGCIQVNLEPDIQGEDGSPRCFTFAEVRELWKREGFTWIEVEEPDEGGDLEHPTLSVNLP